MISPTDWTELWEALRYNTSKKGIHDETQARRGVQGEGSLGIPSSSTDFEKVPTAVREGPWLIVRVHPMLSSDDSESYGESTVVLPADGYYSATCRTSGNDGGCGVGQAVVRLLEDSQGICETGHGPDGETDEELDASDGRAGHHAEDEP
jgi:hypothetical protein